MNDPMHYLQMGMSQLASIAVVIACTVLWLKRRSGWALMALIGELGALTCSLAFVLSPQIFAHASLLLLIWPLNALVFAGGLLGYACIDTTPRTDAPASGTAP